jgi:hypothetical protein
MNGIHPGIWQLNIVQKNEKKEIKIEYGGTAAKISY